ncbi:MAG TPA: NAD(P)-dependent oxidoreductase [Jatrophihabitantaceae bacterium]|nr:NAD(P)-dependent oxidoreductase [Jatrophihabitantaceae bacterium]
MKILVTGGTGAIGRFVCRELEAQGHVPVIASRNRPTGSSDAAEWVEWDMARESALDLLGDLQVTRVIHLAAVVGVAGDADIAETIRVNGSTTVDLLAAARKTGVERLVMMSSKGVYGDLPRRTTRDEGFDENDLPPRPLSAYGISKAVAEWACNAAAHTHQQDVVFVRAASTVGPGKGAQHGATSAPSRMIESAFAGDDVVIAHGGDAIDDFVYNKDLASGLVAACLWPTRLPSVGYHISTGAGVTLKELGAYLQTRFPQVGQSIGDGYNFHGRDHNLHGVLSYARAQRDFGYKPAFPFPLWVDDYIAELAADQATTA